MEDSSFIISFKWFLYTQCPIIPNFHLRFFNSSGCFHEAKDIVEGKNSAFELNNALSINAYTLPLSEFCIPWPVRSNTYKASETVFFGVTLIMV